MEILKVRIPARAAQRLAVVEVRRGLDLDDVGAPVGELADRCRSCPHTRQIENGKARERV
jgi:hypothetical protein